MAVHHGNDRAIISQIAGRHLVFDRRHISFLRRHCTTCGILVGTVPQSPTQNVFLGVPLELTEEEARVLVENNLASLRFETQFQVRICYGPEIGARNWYISRLRSSRREVERVMAEYIHHRKRPVAEGYSGSNTAASMTSRSANDFVDTTPQSLGTLSECTAKRMLCSVTSTSVDGQDSSPLSESVAPLRCDALFRQLRGGRYYTTPGLRFGARLSVYPGDPFRFHAHYLANGYGWEDPISLLDVVSGGRLSTTVKKGFLIGGADDGLHSEDNVARMFCIEWAGM